MNHVIAANIALLLLSAFILQPAHAERPNVILIMTDDQSYGDFGVTGNPAIETPHLDQLARNGAWMKTFYVSPVCSPTRACLMTGRYNYRTRCIDTYIGRSMMEPTERTIAEYMQQAGYATGIFGKWHLGDCYPMRPMDQGFAESLVLKGGGLAQPSDPLENQRRYTDPILFHNGQQVSTSGYCTDVYFDAALKFIEQNHQEGRPFFAYIATNAPHGPVHDVPAELLEHYRGKQAELEKLLVGRVSDEQRANAIDLLARIAAMITNIDQNVGRLVQRLEQLEIDDETLVVFMIDNGPDTRRFVGPFRGLKSSVYEGGIRSPLWLYWPGRLPAGMQHDELVAHIDLLPTILEACGITPPADAALDGRSFWPLLTDQTATWPERTVVIQSHRGDQPVRYHQFMIRRGRWKLLHNSGFSDEKLERPLALELYDVEADPGETQNVVDAHPQIKQELLEAYDRWFDDVSSTRTDNYAPPRIVVGSEHENPTILTRQDWRGGTWAPQSVGHWLLHVERPGRYDVQVIFQPVAEGPAVELRVNDDVLTGPIAQDARTWVAEGVDLPAGDVRLQAARLDASGLPTHGAYQVVVTRK